MRKKLFCDISRDYRRVFSIENISFSLKLLSGNFMSNPSLRLSYEGCSKRVAYFYLETSNFK